MTVFVKQNLTKLNRKSKESEKASYKGMEIFRGPRRLGVTFETSERFKCLILKQGCPGSLLVLSVLSINLFEPDLVT